MKLAPPFPSALIGLFTALPLSLGCARTPPAPRAAEPMTTPSPAAVSAMPTVSAPPGTTLLLTTPAAAARALSIESLPADPTADAADVVVDETWLGQRIESFGGAFNEAGWDALSVLAEEERTAVLRRLFAAGEGLRLDYCRTPIGASDYAMDRYTLSETDGDYAMEHFSIARDRQRLIPYIKAALAVRPDLKLWASAWTPPTWMKTNRAFDSGAMKDDPRVYDAYALYLLKFIEAYRGEGIEVSMVVPQNEPGQLTRYPSADWTPAQYSRFIGDHLGPLLEEQSPQTSIFVGTINRHDWDSIAVLKDPKVARYVDGAAYQWRAIDNVATVHATFPELPLMQSETECGNNHWQPGFDPDRAPNDFRYAVHTWRKVRDFIQAGVSSYMLWNLVLDREGKNLDSKRPWPQNAAVVVDRQAKRVTYTPMYWVMHHYSAVLERGARLTASHGPFDDQIAFVQPDGTVVVQLLNDGPSEREVSVRVRDRVHRVRLPAQSIGSLLAPAPA